MKIPVVEASGVSSLSKKLASLEEFDFVSVQPDKVLNYLRLGGDLILLDINLPQKDGLEVLAAIRNLRRGEPVIVLTLSAENLELQKTREAIEKSLQPHTEPVSKESQEFTAGKWRDIPLDEVSKGMGISRAMLARILGVSERNLARWIAGDSTPRGSHDQSVQKLKYLFFLLRRAIRQEAIPRYLRASNQSLGGRTPLMVLQDGDFRSVEADLLQLIEGVYS
jgi:CheY-like chemotaxis protein